MGVDSSLMSFITVPSRFPSRQDSRPVKIPVPSKLPSRNADSLFHKWNRLQFARHALLTPEISVACGPNFSFFGAIRNNSLRRDRADSAGRTVSALSAGNHTR
jgi:hypothetical protein